MIGHKVTPEPPKAYYEARFPDGSNGEIVVTGRNDGGAVYIQRLVKAGDLRFTAMITPEPKCEFHPRNIQSVVMALLEVQHFFNELAAEQLGRRNGPAN